MMYECMYVCMPHEQIVNVSQLYCCAAYIKAIWMMVRFGTQINIRRKSTTTTTTKTATTRKKTIIWK